MPERNDGTPRGTIVNVTPVTRLLHQYRTDAGWPSCRAIAVKAGLSASSVSDVVTGRKSGSLGTVVRITGVLDGDTDAIACAWTEAAAQYDGIQFDSETHLMEQIVVAFVQLDPSARSRVLAYLRGRFAAELRV